jgi:hypothetical protein
VHDHAGRIISVSQFAAGVKAMVIVGPGQSVLMTTRECGCYQGSGRKGLSHFKPSSMKRPPVRRPVIVEIQRPRKTASDRLKDSWSAPLPAFFTGPERLSGWVGFLCGA